MDPRRNPQNLRTTHQIISRAAPTGGLNYRDPYAAMPVGDARKLENLIPDVGGLRVRSGYREWSTDIASAVKSIHAYTDQEFTDLVTADPPTGMPGGLFAVTDDDILDVTDATVPPASVFSMSGTGRAGEAYSSMMTNSAGSFMILCSEDDGYLLYDGTTWAAGSVNNVAESDLVYPLVWKRRVWFVERDSTSAWYLAADAISGDATEFNFGPHFKHGGYLAFLASWTIDAGEGIDDFLVAVSSSGDVVVYKGSDPSSPSTFGLVGSWFIGQIPVGRRGHCQYGGDLLLLSLDGLMPISYVTRGGSGLLQASSKEYSSKIRAALNTDLRSTAGSVGWGMFLYPTERILVVTEPEALGSPNKQFALSTTLNSWCELSNIPILSFCVAYGYAFAGTSDGRVLLLFSGDTDNSPLAGEGSSIISKVQPAYEYFDAPLNQKMFHMVRPLLISMLEPSVFVGISVDFSNVVGELSDVIYPASEFGALWDISLWDEGIWSDSLGQFHEWMKVTGNGVSGSCFVEIHSSSPTTLLSIDYMLSSGGVL